MTRKYITKKDEGNNYPIKVNIFLWVNAYVMLLPFLLFTSLIDKYSMNIPHFIRIIGIVDFILVIVIMIWQMKTLGVNISSTHAERSLIIKGPYKYVRHPLYTIFILMAIDIWLISANWILLIGIPSTIVAGKIRANYEDKVLIHEYHDRYLEYMKITGQLFPKLLD